MQAIFVDDENYLLELMKRYFELIEVPLDTFSEADDAFQSLSKGGYDLVMLDYNLPGADIESFIGNVLAFNSGCKIIIVSGEEREFVELDMDDEGPLYFLHKPFTINHLVDRINELFPEFNISL